MNENQTSKSWDYSKLLTIILIIGTVFSIFFFIDSRYAKKGVVSTNNREFVLIPASKLWVTTTIIVKPNETIRIKASGLVNLAIHRVVFNAKENERPNIDWNDPDGVLNMPEDKPLYLKRRQSLVLPKAKYGTLLMYPLRKGETAPSKYNAFPQNIQVVGTFLEYSNTSAEDVILCFVINDTVFRSEPEYKSAFVGTQEEIDLTYGKGKETVAKREESYNKIAAASYWERWFDDNAGEFLVEVERIE